jgi:hypothetical protein
VYQFIKLFAGEKIAGILIAIMAATRKISIGMRKILCPLNIALTPNSILKKALSNCIHERKKRFEDRHTINEQRSIFFEENWR